MTCGEFIGRISLFVVSLLLIGGTILLSVWTFTVKQLIEDARTDQFATTSSSLLGFSVYLALFSIFGFCASFCYSKSRTKQFVFILTLNALICIAVLAVSLSDFKTAPDEIEKELTHLQTLYDWDHSASPSDEVKNATEIWDLLQQDMGCCGVSSPKDWTKTDSKRDPNLLPMSCCVEQKPLKSSATPSGTKYDASQYCDSTKMKIFSEGCAMLMKDSVSVLKTVLIVIIGISLVLDVYFIIHLVFSPARRDPFNGYGYGY